MTKTKLNFRILWVGDKALQLFQQTNQSVLDQYEHSILLFDRKDKKIQIPVYDLKEISGNDDLEYTDLSLNATIKEHAETLGFNNLDLLIGSSYEKLFQTVLRSMGSKEVLTSEVQEKSALFSESLYRQLDPTFDHPHLPTILFLNQEIPFRDLKQESQKTIQFTSENFVQIYTTTSTNSDINEFLFRFADAGEYPSSGAQIKQLK